MSTKGSGKKKKVPDMELEHEFEEAHIEAERERIEQEHFRKMNMNSFQWLALQMETVLEKGLDLMLGPPTQDALRPSGTLRENHMLQTERRKKKKAAGSTAGSVRSDGTPKRTKSGRRIPTEFERQAAAKRRAMQILELQREEEEWRAEVKEAAAGNAQDVARQTGVQLGGLYAVSQACLLSIFVPQKCPKVTACLPDGSNLDSCTQSKWFDYPVDVPDGHLCSLKENVDWWNLTQRNRDCFLINCTTLFLMLIGQAYFWKREVWMINHLEEDNSVPYDNLPSEIEELKGELQGDMQAAVYSYNLGALIMAGLIMLFVIINFGVSADFLINGDELYNYNLGTRTIVGLLTNTMLVSTKVIGYLSYARLSYANAWAISMFTVVPLSYNKLDATTRPREKKTIADIPIEFDDVSEKV